MEQVKEMDSMLGAKKTELMRADALANEKLQQMVHDQQEAENKRVLSLSIREELRLKEQEVAERKLKVRT